MSLMTIVLIVLVLLLVGAVPAWPHSRVWGYGPSGGLGLVVLVLTDRASEDAERRAVAATNARLLDSILL